MTAPPAPLSPAVLLDRLQEAIARLDRQRREDQQTIRDLREVLSQIATLIESARFRIVARDEPPGEEARFIDAALLAISGAMSL